MAPLAKLPDRCLKLSLGGHKTCAMPIPRGTSSCHLPWLSRLRENPHVVCMTVTPLWASTVWLSLLVKLQKPHTKALVIPTFQGMFENCWGQDMPAPRWPLLCTMLSQKAYKSNRCHLQQLHYTCPTSKAWKDMTGPSESSGP